METDPEQTPRTVEEPSGPAKREFGALKGMVSIGPEFFEPLPEDELAAWE